MSCVNTVGLSNFDAQLSNVRNEALMSWSVANATNIDHFDIWEKANENVGFVWLANIPAQSGKLDYTYKVGFNSANLQRTYRLEAVKHGGCTIQATNQPSITSACHQADAVQLQNLIQQKIDTNIIKLSFDIPSNSLPQTSMPTQPFLHYENNHIGLSNQNGSLHYEAICTCPDTLQYPATLVLVYSPAVTYCWDTTYTVMLNCSKNVLKKGNSTVILGSNPANTDFWVILPKGKNYANINIFNSNGMLVNSFVQNIETKQYDCSAFSNGFYIVMVDDGSKQTALKLVKY